MGNESSNIRRKNSQTCPRCDVELLESNMGLHLLDCCGIQWIKDASGKCIIKSDLTPEYLRYSAMLDESSTQHNEQKKTKGTYES
jgi:Zn-finger nucleic acid-binding protein